MVIPGIGPKRREALAKRGLVTPRDFLFTFPAAYQFKTHITSVQEAVAGQARLFMLHIGKARLSRFGGKTLVACAGEDETGRLQLVFFNQPYVQKRLEEGKRLYFYGAPATYKNKLTLVNPNISEDYTPGIYPVYNTRGDLPQKTWQAAVKYALENERKNTLELLPEGLLREFQLMPEQDALTNIHFPLNEQSLLAAKRRFAFFSLLLFQVALHRQTNKRREPAAVIALAKTQEESFFKRLPFAFTPAQQRCYEEIKKDLAAGVAMNRLLQGDVGSGKTVLAFYCLYAACQQGGQAVLMAPTDVLAAQHYREFCRLFPEISAGFLSGACTAKEKQLVKSRMAAGEVQVAIGTHALLEQDVVYNNLLLAVTDEQHRFGVSHRAKLQNKGENPHVLVMSATPIPRTLALYLFKDLEVSLLDELPPGRRQVQTKLVARHREADLFNYIAKEAQQGRQSFVVCPLIEETETQDLLAATELFARLKAGPLHAVSAALLHGRLANTEKAAIMERFRTGEVKVLVTTTVIEVGVNVPAAVNMAICNAERFGLAQLHQLRGRVGRSSQQAYCFLLTATAGEKALERLMLLTQTADGFLLAEKDLELRGPGDYIGLRQSGQGSELFGNKALLEETARAAALLYTEAYSAYLQKIYEHLEQQEKKQPEIVMN